jgi:MOSC domain-containing protein YiiM
LEHYAFWNEQYEGAALGPGSVGENWTLAGTNEALVYVGDIYRVGTARVQVTGPRVPCAKQERKVRLPGFLQRVRETRRTGWYLRVLTPGSVAAGDELALEWRPADGLTVEAINVIWHGEPDAALAQAALNSGEVPDDWKEMIRRRLEHV